MVLPKILNTLVLQSIILLVRNATTVERRRLQHQDREAQITCSHRCTLRATNARQTKINASFCIPLFCHTRMLNGKHLRPARCNQAPSGLQSELSQTLCASPGLTNVPSLCCRLEHWNTLGCHPKFEDPSHLHVSRVIWRRHVSLKGQAVCNCRVRWVSTAHELLAVGICFGDLQVQFT